jgi:hypothetical protein
VFSENDIIDDEYDQMFMQWSFKQGVSTFLGF